MKRRTLPMIALVVAGVYLVGYCQGRERADTSALRARGDTTDARVARFVAREVEREHQVRRDSAAAARALGAQRDSTRVARRRSDSLGAALRARGPLAPDVQAALDAQDATIAQQDRALAEKDRSILFWQGVAARRAATIAEVARQRDEYRDERDDWRRKARSRCGTGGAVGRAARGGFDAVIGFTCRIPLPLIG